MERVVGFRAALVRWFALSTRGRFEQSTADLLISKGYEVLVPTREVSKELFGRVKTVKEPLFPGYIFCRLDASVRLPILTTPGVMSIIGSGREPTPVPDEEIDRLTRVLRSPFNVEECSFIPAGQMVQVKAGVLRGLEGIVLDGGNRPKLVISVRLLQRSVAVELDRGDIRAL
jgi:transcription antitermination factor NusG